MDGLFTLIALGAVMAVASFLAGSLPLSLSLSPSQMRLISTIGMGVLVGTSLIVIIPEGVETLYSAKSNTVERAKRDLSSLGTEPRWHATNVVRMAEEADINPFLTPGPVVPSSEDLPPKTPTQPGVVGIMEESETSPAQHADNDHHDHGESPHAWIGVALISGFIMMFLVDKLPQRASAARSKPRTHHIALNNLGRRFNMTTSLDEDDQADGFLETATTKTQEQSFATTTGLVIHAAADGIALGASSSIADSGLSLIIFFAIMVHKAPAAFGLTSILLSQGLSKRTARGHLILFSLAAPVGSLLTWTFAHVVGAVNTGNADSTKWWTGILLLFSGGTFLYVAMHSMQEITEPSPEAHLNGHAGPSSEGREQSQREQKPSLRDLSAACFGMILPLFLQIGHAH